jgi:hypothetical protein
VVHLAFQFPAFLVLNDIFLVLLFVFSELFLELAARWLPPLFSFVKFFNKSRVRFQCILFALDVLLDKAMLDRVNG